ncbi:MAG: hypothetical protein ACYDDU_20125 [Dermatophilaceae bacterium]
MGRSPGLAARPYDVTPATRLTDESLYAGKLVQRRNGQWVLLALVNQGTLDDLMPLGGWLNTSEVPLARGGSASGQGLDLRPGARTGR